MATINGRAYSYSHISLTIGNVEVVSPSSIEYSVEQEKTNEYGLGDKPIMRGVGVKQFSASIELSFGEIQYLREKAKELNPNSSGSLVDLPPFKIVVLFNNGEKLVRHTLLGCEFTKDGVSGSQGDTNLKYSLDLVVADIKFV